MESLGKLLLLVGFTFLVIGTVVFLAGKVAGVGRLPGDLVFSRGSFTIYFPLATMIIVSIVLSLLLTIVLRFFRS